MRRNPLRAATPVHAPVHAPVLAPVLALVVAVVLGAVGIADSGPARADYDEARKALDRRDFRSGVAALRTAAHDGDARAQNHLGTLFEDGRVVARDFGRAVFWYRKSAEQGNAEGQLNLGRMYRGGMGLERDERRAAYWYRAAAGKGVAAAQFFLGLMYEAGQGVERDREKSWMWFSLAAEQGDEDARFRRDRLTSAFSEEELAKAGGALRGYLEATSLRGPEPSAPRNGTGSTAGSGADGDAPGAAEKPMVVRGNPRVFRIQVALADLGYDPGEQDGEPGTRTRDAVRKFEAEHGYRRRGRLDDRTLRRLRDALESGKPAGSVVRVIQTHLRRLGYRPGAVDGRPGPRTAAAIEAFQRDRGLPVDGRLTLDLMRVLRGVDS